MAVLTGRSDPLNVVNRRHLEPGRYPIGRVVRQVEKDQADLAKRLRAAGFVGVKDPPSRAVIGGYVSNIKANLFQGTRQAKETLVDLTTQGSRATYGEALNWARSVVPFKPGPMDLSIGSHARAFARQAMADIVWSDPEEFRVGILLPRQAEGSATPGGVLSRVVGRIFTPSEWAKISRELNKTRKGLSQVWSLGLHHGDRHQLLPISASFLAAALERMAVYRQLVLDRIRRRGR